jgi:hypothetical protein
LSKAYSSKIISNITFWTFYNLYGFGSYNTNNTTTYLAIENAQFRLFRLDADWNLLDDTNTCYSTSYLSRPGLMIRIEKYFYLSFDNYFLKTDFNLNVVGPFFKVSTGIVPKYRGLWYNSSNNLIYVASNYWYTIDVFDLNISKIDSISTLTNSTFYYPWSLQGNGDKLFCGTDQGVLLVILNKLIIQTINVCNISSRLSSILFDQYGYVGFTCKNENILKLYYTNLSYTGLQKALPANPEFINFDEKGRFIVISDKRITVYN